MGPAVNWIPGLEASYLALPPNRVLTPTKGVPFKLLDRHPELVAEVRKLAAV